MNFYFVHVPKGEGLTFKANALFARTPRPDLKAYGSNQIFDRITMRQKVIYGDDDRIETKDIKNALVKNNANSVAAIFLVKDLIPNDDGTVSIPSDSFADEYARNGNRLCDKEPFQNQPAGAICTAFLVAQDIVVTAGHYMNEDTLHEYRFVFGYEVLSDNTTPTDIDINNVYGGIKLLGWDLDGDGADWAVVKLDRCVADRQPLGTCMK